MQEQEDILTFISYEQHNVLASIANLKDEFNAIRDLDFIFREALLGLSINENDPSALLTSTMYQRAHGEFYSAMANFLKGHVSKSYISFRIAIEAAFNAYYFMVNPSDARHFTDIEHDLQKARFVRIKDHVKKNLEIFPLAKGLVVLHEQASKFSAHASAYSFAYKYKRLKNDEKNINEILVNHFDELSTADFMGYYFNLLMGFYMIFDLFQQVFFKKMQRVEYPSRRERVRRLERVLTLKQKQHQFNPQK